MGSRQHRRPLSGGSGVNGSAGSGGYSTGSVASRDGTVIGYRQVSQGPGIIAVHGGIQAAQNLMKLAHALADSFTVYLPDRRGRGLTGPPGRHYSLATECEDLSALAKATGAHNIFGLSPGAIIALQAPLVLPAIRKPPSTSLPSARDCSKSPGTRPNLPGAQ